MIWICGDKTLFLIKPYHVTGLIFFQIKAVNYCCKELHLRCLWEPWIRFCCLSKSIATLTKAESFYVILQRL